MSQLPRILDSYQDGNTLLTHSRNYCKLQKQKRCVSPLQLQAKFDSLNSSHLACMLL